MPPIDAVVLDHRGLILRNLGTWQDGDLGPVDGSPMPGIVRLKFPWGDVWDLSGAAADRFREAVRELAWRPPAAGSRGAAPRVEYLDPETGEAVPPGLGPDAGGPRRWAADPEG